jgi:hypothetical protein
MSALDSLGARLGCLTSDAQGSLQLFWLAFSLPGRGRQAVRTAEPFPLSRGSPGMQRRAASRGLDVRSASTAIARGCPPGLRCARCAPNFFPSGSGLHLCMSHAWMGSPSRLLGKFHVPLLPFVPGRWKVHACVVQARWWHSLCRRTSYSL